jgi:hypothetical protein
MNLINANSKQFLIIVSFSVTLFALPKDTIITAITAKDASSKTGDILGVPFIYYAPETGWAAGGRLGYYWKKNQSCIYSNLFLSQKNQYELFFGGEIYRGQWKFIPKLKGSKWIDLYYGLGNNSQDLLKIPYNEKFIWAFLSAQRRFGPIYAGLEAESRVEKTFNTLPENLPGSKDWHTAGIGARITFDSRENIYYPSNGQFCESSLRFFLPFNRSLSYFRWIVDYRHFNHFFKNVILALQLKTDLSSGDIPIQVMPSVGDLVRGYETYRYRDNAVIYGQIETRAPVWKRFSGVAFLGAGDVFRTFQDLGAERIKIAVGGGLRFRLTENKVNLRLDCAMNRQSNLSMYLEIGEAF